MTYPPQYPPPGPPPGQWPGQQPAWQQPHTGAWHPAVQHPQLQQPPPKPDPPLGCVLVAASVILAIVVIGVVAVMGGDDETPSAPPAAAPRTAGLSDEEIGRLAMLTAIRSKYPQYKRVPDGQLVELGETSCEALRAGNSFVAVGVTLSTKARIGLDEAGYLVGAFVSGLCPDQRSKIPQ